MAEYVSAVIGLAQFAAMASTAIKDFIKGGKAYDDVESELVARLDSLSLILQMASRSAQKIESSTLLERDRAEALLLIKQSVESSRRTIRQLFTCRNKLRPPESLSTLQRAILYWRHQNDGKSIIEDGLKEINERVKEISVAFTCVNTNYLADIHDTVTDPDRPLVSRTSSINTQSSSSTLGSSISSVESRTLREEDFSWSPDIFLDDNSASIAGSAFGSFIQAIRDKDRATVRRHLADGIEIFATHADGWGVLHHAVKAGSKRLLRELLGSAQIKGTTTEIDKQDKTGATALHFAALSGRKDLASELIQAGADKDIIDHYNRSPLFMAVQGNHDSLVELLLDNGARVVLSDLPPRFKEMKAGINLRKREAKKRKKP